MTTRVVIAGAGGFGRGVHAWLESSPRHLSAHAVSEIVFIDDRHAGVAPRAQLLSTIEAYEPEPHDALICAVGAPSIRKRLVAALAAKGASFHTFIDDRAVVAASAWIGAGSVVCPGAVISADAKLGEHVHVNFNCSIGHDSVIGAYSTLSPAVNVMGEVEIGANVFLGGSATVLPRLAIGDGALIGAGAVVVRGIGNDDVAIGNPARLRRARVEEQRSDEHP